MHFNYIHVANIANSETNCMHAITLFKQKTNIFDLILQLFSFDEFYMENVKV